MDLQTACSFCCILVQHSHAFKSRFHIVQSDLISLKCCGENTGADLLGEDDPVANAGSVVGEDLSGVHNTCDRKTVFGLVVNNAVAADHGAVCLSALSSTALKDALDNIIRQEIGNGEHIQGLNGVAAHGPDVGQRVGSANQTEGVGVVDDGREEVNGGNNSCILADLVNTSIIGRLETDQKIRIRIFWNPAQYLSERSGRELGCSTSNLNKL